MNDMYADTIEWWENDDGVFNWHAISDENGNILFGSVQGYENKGDMLRYVSHQFPDATIRPRDGEPQASHVTASPEQPDDGEEPIAIFSDEEDTGAKEDS